MKNLEIIHDTLFNKTISTSSCLIKVYQNINMMYRYEIVGVKTISKYHEIPAIQFRVVLRH